MGNIFDGLKDVFAGLITGIAATPCRFIIHPEGRVFNPSTAEYEAVADIDSGPLICTPPDEYDINQIDGTDIKQGDFKVLVGYDQWIGLDADFGDKPTKGMVIRIETDQHIVDAEYREHTIENVKPFETGENVAVWEIQCRNG